MIDKIKQAEKQFYDSIEEYFGKHIRSYPVAILNTVKVWLVCDMIDNQVLYIKFDDDTTELVFYKEKRESKDGKYVLFYAQYLDGYRTLIFDNTKKLGGKT